MILLLQIIIFVILIVIIFWLACLIYAQLLGAPTVYSNEKAILDAFKLAGLKRGETVLDLGCGDARSLILATKKFGAKGIGIERSPYCFLKAKLNVFTAGEKENINIIFGDLNKSDQYLKQADVIYLYLLNSVLEKIEDWLFATIKKEARVVSLAFSFKKHRPKEDEETINLGRKTKVRLY